MAEVDTSSYPRATLPVQKSALDQAQQMGTMQQQQQSIESGKLTIDKQKLDLVNQRFGEMAKGFTALIADKDLNNDKFRKYVQDQVKLGYINPEMASVTLSNAPQDPTQLRGYLQTQLQHAQTIVGVMNTHFGENQDQSSGATNYQGVRASPMMGGGFTPTTQINQQLPPTQPIQNAQGAPGLVGPAGPAGVQPAAVPMPAPRPSGLPVAAPAVAAPPAVSGPSGPTVNNGTEFNNRFSAAFPNAIQTGPAPGVAAAKGVVGEQSGKDYASDLSRANNYQEVLYPATKVLDILKNSGPQDFGPGTDKFNEFKSAVATWFPNAVDKEAVDKITNFNEMKKYLVQAARGSGNTGTNDQLAAAFSANPSVSMNNATIENVVKSAVALQKMKMAQTLMFGQTGQPESEYSKWISKNQNQFDPRAFGFDMMGKNAQTKLLDGFTEKDSDSKEMKAAKTTAYNKFRKSLQFAHDANLIGQ